MATVNPPNINSPNPKAVALKRRSLKTVLALLKLGLSEADKKNYKLLDDIFDKAWWFREKEEYRLRLEKVFASPLHSDESKRYFAAKYIDSELVLQEGVKFLTEEIILGHITRPTEWLPNDAYIKAIMVSPLLSEDLIETTLQEIGSIGRKGVLELIPDILITPKVINAWRLTIPHGEIPWRTEIAIGDAASRIEQIYPEYEGCPDEWTVKVFCG